MNIAGVNVSELSKDEILTKIKDFLTDSSKHLIFTPNPEMIVLANEDWSFKKTLNSADLAPADGIGLVWATKFLYKKNIKRLPGVELMEEICKIAEKGNQKIFLLGGEEGIADKVSLRLKEKFSRLSIVGATGGLKFISTKSVSPRLFLRNWQFDEEQNKKIINQIKEASPDIIFVAFGHDKQEKWLAEFLPELPSVKIGMGVGGSFDFFAGKIKRAPQIFRQLGLEWLWRFVRQPIYRFKRIWRAVFVFSYYVLKYKITLKLPYRKNVIGFVINNKGNFFIGKRKIGHLIDEVHWQPPQGGIETNEDPKQAVVREIKEETGLDAQVICSAKTKNIYDWSLKCFSTRCFKYRGQMQEIFVLKYNGDDDPAKIDAHEFEDYKWVNLEELKKILHPLRQPALKILLEECGEYLKNN